MVLAESLALLEVQHDLVLVDVVETSLAEGQREEAVVVLPDQRHLQSFLLVA